MDMNYLKYLLLSQKQRSGVIRLTGLLIVSIFVTIVSQYSWIYPAVTNGVIWLVYAYAAYPNYTEDKRTGNWK